MATEVSVHGVMKTNDKVVNLIARSMQNNVTISGLEGDQKEENCRMNIIQFLRGIMLILVVL